jgi:hypothetical protein
MMRMMTKDLMKMMRMNLKVMKMTPVLHQIIIISIRILQIRSKMKRKKIM